MSGQFQTLAMFFWQFHFLMEITYCFCCQLAPVTFKFAIQLWCQTFFTREMKRKEIKAQTMRWSWENEQEVTLLAGRVRVRHRQSWWELCGWWLPCWPWRGWSGWRGGWGPSTGWWGSVVRPVGTAWPPLWHSCECHQHTFLDIINMVNIWVAGFVSTIQPRFEILD